MTPRILFVYQSPSPFVLQDRDLLQKHFEVTEFRWSDHRHPARALPAWMFRRRRTFDLALFWFADAHASVGTRAAKLLRKPSVIVVGGYDASDAPGYGFLSTKRGLARARGHFNRATRIVAVSKGLARQVSRRFPAAAGKIDVLATGVDANRFRPAGPRTRSVLSVAGASEWMRAKVKGWDRIPAAACLLPDTRFLLIGAAPEVVRRLDAPPNLSVRGPVAQADLIPHYQRATAYLQPSRSEGLPNTLMEAMACGCVPVVTRVGGMPELVEGVGFVVEGDARAIAVGVREALDRPSWGVQARARIVERFSLSRREEGLVRIVGDMVASSAA